MSIANIAARVENGAPIAGTYIINTAAFFQIFHI